MAYYQGKMVLAIFNFLVMIPIMKNFADLRRQEELATLEKDPVIRNIFDENILPETLLPQMKNDIQDFYPPHKYQLFSGSIESKVFIEQVIKFLTKEIVNPISIKDLNEISDVLETKFRMEHENFNESCSVEISDTFGMLVNSATKVSIQLARKVMIEEETNEYMTTGETDYYIQKFLNHEQAVLRQKYRYLFDEEVDEEEGFEQHVDHLLTALLELKSQK